MIILSLSNSAMSLNSCGLQVGSKALSHSSTDGIMGGTSSKQQAAQERFDRWRIAKQKAGVKGKVKKGTAQYAAVMRHFKEPSEKQVIKGSAEK